MKSKLTFIKINLLIIGLMAITIQAISKDAPITNIGNATACPGEAVTVPVTVTNFAGIASVSLRIDYNPEFMTYISNTNVNPVFTGILINEVTVSSTLHKIIIVWSDVYPVNLSNGATLLELNFTYLSGTATLVLNNTSNSGGDCEYADENGDPMNDDPTASFYNYGQIFSFFPVEASLLSGAVSVCQGSTGVVYSVPPITNATGYVWTLPTGVTIKLGSNTNNITVDFSVSAVSGLVSVYGTNRCGNGIVSNIAVTINPRPTGVTASANPNPICESATLTLTGEATGATDWSWTGPNGFISTSQSPTIGNITTAGAGVYSLTAANSCGSASPVNTESVIVSCVGLPETKDFSVNIYPNPTSNLFTFVYQSANGQPLTDLDLYNSVGVHIKSLLNGINATELNQQFSLPPLPNGTYFLVARTKDRHYVLNLSIYNKL